MITGIILVNKFNPHLSECLRSLEFCDEIIAVNDNAEPQVLEIIKKNQIRIITNKLAGDFSAQRNFAISKAKNPWILFIDSDEVVSDDLKKSIINSTKKTDYSGYFIKRVDKIYGKELHYGDVGNVWILRLAKKEEMVWHNRIHEIAKVKGNTGNLDGIIVHYPFSNFSEFIEKLNTYSSIRAQELKSQNLNSNILQIIFYPIFKFLYLWIIKLGFMDGILGLMHAFMMSFYTFLTRGKLYLLSKGIS